MEHFDPRSSSPSSSATGSRHARSCRRCSSGMLKLPDERAAPSTTCRRCRSVVHAAAPCPVDGEAPDDRVVGPDHPRVLRRHRGQRLRVLRQRGLAGPPGHRRARRSSARSTSSATTATELPPGEPGTIYFEGGGRLRVPQRPREDRRRPATPAGWSTLGDVGYLDDDGYLYLTDRKAYMIISGGVNIYPQEAENVLVSHPKVVDVAVFGVPNADFGEEVKAVVQPVSTGRRRARARAGADRLLPRAAGRRQVPALDRLPRRAAPPPDRQALQAPAQGRVLGRPRQRAGSSDPARLLAFRGESVVKRPNRRQNGQGMIETMRSSVISRTA